MRERENSNLFHSPEACYGGVLGPVGTEVSSKNDRCILNVAVTVLVKTEEVECRRKLFPFPFAMITVTFCDSIGQDSYY